VVTEPVVTETAWWVGEYGNPCRECGFSWAEPPEEAIAEVETLPARFADLLAGRTGEEVAQGATWSAKAYVFHVADNLRVFAERLEGVRAGGPTALAAYDQDELAAARGYEHMSVQSALWSVQASVRDWAAAARASLHAPTTTYRHAERGELTAAEITRGPAHDAVHHLWDVTRAVRS
jgi:hypothetical protein